MNGGAGDDVYIVDNASDVTNGEATGGGTDLVMSSVTRTLGGNFENLTLTGNGAINGTGQGLANIIIGNDANNTLTGNGGDDELWGMGGIDNLLGGNGNDLLRGGEGDDVLNGGGGNDVLRGGAGNDVLTGGGAGDTFLFATDEGSFGNDVITDFDGVGNGTLATQDLIDLTAFSIIGVEIVGALVTVTYLDGIDPNITHVGTILVSGTGFGEEDILI
jgi:Ca2+-binding RTX toxin-like protein